MGNESTQAPADIPVAAGAAKPRRRLPSFGAAFFRAWHERHYANKCCRQLHGLYEQVCATEPTLRGFPLYSRVVQEYLGCDEGAAARVLSGAEESYSDWPRARMLTFRDVAHYLTVVGLCKEPEGAGWVGTELRPIVSRWMPTQW
jgi:hypothetical protein